MEITINIPQNTYSVPTEVRSEAVQKICDAFLYGRSNRIFYPGNDGCGRDETHYAYKTQARPNPDPSNTDDWFYGFTDKRWAEKHYTPETCIQFNGAEMRAAFKALIEAGYHIFRVYSFGSWKGYILDRKPVHPKGVEVHEFTDFID